MNAADVLAEAFNAATSEPRVDYGHHIDALLAHGEQGVAILPDGTLWALESYFDTKDRTYILVPVAAEAGDTDAVPNEWGENAAGFAEWLTPERHERFFSAEAGDTDG